MLQILQLKSFPSKPSSVLCMKMCQFSYKTLVVYITFLIQRKTKKTDFCVDFKYWSNYQLAHAG